MAIEVKTNKTVRQINKVLDKDNLQDLMNFYPRLQDVAAFFRCSQDKIEIYIRDNYDMTFREFKEAYSTDVRLSIVQKALELVNKGNTAMVIFCLKNMLGWTDKLEANVNANVDSNVKALVMDAFSKMVKDVSPKQNETIEISNDSIQKS